MTTVPMNSGPMNFGRACDAVFAAATMPDGYAGHRALVAFALVDGRVYTVTEAGCFWSGIDAQEIGGALTLLRAREARRQIQDLRAAVDWYPLLRILDGPMETEIEIMVENAINNADRRYLRGDCSRGEYEQRIRQIDRAAKAALAKRPRKAA